MISLQINGPITWLDVLPYILVLFITIATIIDAARAEGFIRITRADRTLCVLYTFQASGPIRCNIGRLAFRLYLCLAILDSLLIYLLFCDMCVPVLVTFALVFIAIAWIMVAINKRVHILLYNKDLILNEG